MGNTDFDAAIAAARSRLRDDLQHRVVSGEGKDTVVDAAAALIAEMEEILKRQTMPTSQVEDLICSFCDKHHDNVAKLIAGPTVYICDGCIGEAGALFMRYG